MDQEIENLKATIQRLTGQNIAQQLALKMLIGKYAHSERDHLKAGIRGAAENEHLNLGGEENWKHGFQTEIEVLTR